MYDEHYGLTSRPFQLTPDPRFWFDTATHRKAMAYLGYGLSQGEGFIVITGDPGAGKTTLVGHLMSRIDPEQLNVIRIVSTQIDTEDLLRLVAEGLGLDPTGLPKAHLLGAIERGLHAVAREGRRTLLIVDEAQSLPVASLEELRMLSNFQLGGHPLLQIFLLGQPEFRTLLHGEGRIEQLRQRVIAMHHLDPMGPEEVEAYITHRLSVVGWRGRPSFSQAAFAAMHRWSGGVPRRLNQLANRVLLFGAVDGIDAFDAADIETVIADIDGDSMPVAPPPAAPEPQPLAFEEEHVELAQPAWEPPAGAFEPVQEAAVAEPPPEEVGPGPLPMTPSPAIDPPRPILAEAPQAVASEADADAAQEQPSPADAAVLARIAELEARLDEQDAALRRVLALLVDWVEGEAARPSLTPLRGVA